MEQKSYGQTVPDRQTPAFRYIFSWAHSRVFFSLFFLRRNRITKKKQKQPKIRRYIPNTGLHRHTLSWFARMHVSLPKSCGFGQIRRPQISGLPSRLLVAIGMARQALTSAKGRGEASAYLVYPPTIQSRWQIVPGLELRLLLDGSWESWTYAGTMDQMAV